jgi:hypothetical protein
LDLELLLEVVGFLAVTLRKLTLSLGTLGRFLRGLLVVLRFTRVEVGFLAVAAGLFAEPFALQLTLRSPAARRDHGEDQQDYGNDDDGNDQSG